MKREFGIIFLSFILVGCEASPEMCASRTVGVSTATVTTWRPVK